MLPLRVLVMSLCLLGALLWLAPAVRKSIKSRGHDTPVVINTWAFTDATDAAWAVLASGNSNSAALDAVEEVCMCTAFNLDTHPDVLPLLLMM